MFAPVLFDKIRSAIENRMRRVMTEVQKERLLLVPLNEVDCFDVHAIHQELVVPQPLLGNIDPANRLIAKDIGPEVGTISDAFDFAAKIPREAMVGRLHFVLGFVILVAGQVPLADHPRGITILLKRLGECHVFRGQSIGRIRTQII